MMTLKNSDILHSIHGGQTQTLLTAQETITVYFASAFASNVAMSAIGVSPLSSFPISLFSSVVPVYLYAEAKKNPA